MPPRDMVHGQLVVGSGIEFQTYLLKAFKSFPNIEVLTTDNPKFSNEKSILKQEALEEARLMNADYVLTTSLGEMRDAAAFSFRKDFVSLEYAALYRVSDGKIIWQGLRHTVEGANITTYKTLLVGLAERMVKSMME
jgi:hypothetical protein